LQAKVFEYLISKPDIQILITKDDKDAKIAAYCATYLGYQTYQLPDFRATYGDDLRPYKEEIFEINSALNDYYSNPKKSLLIAPFRTVINALPKKELFQSFDIEFGDTIELVNFKEKLLHWGYTFVEIVEEKGEVSFRGDIIDLYPINANNPVRISLFDDEIESIRIFICETQKSEKDELESLTVIPALFALDSDQYDALENKVANLKSDSFEKDISTLGFWCLEELAEDYLKSKSAICISNIKDDIEDFFSFSDDLEKKEQLLKLPCINEPKTYKDIEVAELNALVNFHKDKKITIIARNEGLAKQSGIDPDIKVTYQFSDLIVNILSDKELIVSLNKLERKKRRKRSKIVLDDLKVNDYVVHESYGIGIFKGLTNTKVLGTVRDFVEIAYQGDDRLLRL